MAISGAQRAKLLPNVPTLIEAGFENIDANFNIGLFAPRETPKDVVAKIQRDVATVLKDPEIQKRFFDIGAEVGGQSSDDFAARVRSDMDLWAKVAKSAGIKPE